MLAACWNAEASEGDATTHSRTTLRAAVTFSAIQSRPQGPLGTTSDKATARLAPISITWPRGAFRPYMNAGIGGQVFFTESAVSGSNQVGDIASTTNHSSLAAAWALGGGASMPLAIGRTPVALDVGMQYVRGGNAKYLGLGSITDLPGARIAVTPLESTTHMMVVRIGARISR